jgi:hypothetical protein
LPAGIAGHLVKLRLYLRGELHFHGSVSFLNNACHLSAPGHGPKATDLLLPAPQDIGSHLVGGGGAVPGDEVPDFRKVVFYFWVKVVPGQNALAAADEAPSSRLSFPSRAWNSPRPHCLAWNA